MKPNRIRQHSEWNLRFYLGKIHEYPIEKARFPSKIPLRNFSRLVIRDHGIRKKTLPANTSFLSKSSSFYLTNLSQVINLQRKSIENIPTSSSSSRSNALENELALEQQDILVNQFIENFCEDLIKTCRNEMISAGLVLFFNSLAEKFVKECVESMLDGVIFSAVSDVKYAEFIEVESDLIEKICTEAVFEVAEVASEQKCIEEIIGKLISELPFREIAEIAFLEEKNYEYEIVYEVFDWLTDFIFTEDWVEEIAEDEIIQQKINENYKLFPSNLQKKLAKKNVQFKTDKIIEEIYFDFLNDFVAGVWLENLAKQCLFPDFFKKTPEKLMPTKTYNFRRGVSLFHNTLLSIKTTSYFK